MQSTVITIKKGAKGCFGTQGKKAYCFRVEADCVVKDNNTFDPDYRVKKEAKEITIYKEGLPQARIKYSRYSGRWSIQFLLDEAAVYQLQLNVKVYSTLKQYLLDIKDENLFLGRFREGTRMTEYLTYSVPNENGVVLKDNASGLKVFVFDEGITHKQASHTACLKDDQGNCFLQRAVLLLEGDDAPRLMARLYQIEMYQALAKEKIDPYSTLAETKSVELIASDQTIHSFELDRNRYDQPKLLDNKAS